MSGVSDAQVEAALQAWFEAPNPLGDLKAARRIAMRAALSAAAGVGEQDEGLVSAVRFVVEHGELDDTSRAALEVALESVPVQQDEPEAAPLPRSRPPRSHRDDESLRRWEARHPSVRFSPPVPVQQDEGLVSAVRFAVEHGDLDDTSRAALEVALEAVPVQQDELQVTPSDSKIWNRGPVQQVEPEGVCAFPNCSCTENRCPGVGGEPCRGCGVPTGIGAYHHIGCRTPEPNPVPVQQEPGPYCKFCRDETPCTACGRTQYARDAEAGTQEDGEYEYRTVEEPKGESLPDGGQRFTSYFERRLIGPWLRAESPAAPAEAGIQGAKRFVLRCQDCGEQWRATDSRSVGLHCSVCEGEINTFVAPAEAGTQEDEGNE